MKKIKLVRGIRGRMWFPDYEFTLEETGQLHWKGTLPTDGVEVEETAEIPSETLAEIQAMAQAIDWGKMDEVYWGDETESVQTFADFVLETGESISIRDDQGGFYYSFTTPRSQYSWLEDYWSKEKVDQYYQYLLFLFHVERLLKIEEWLEKHFPQRLKAFKENALRRSNGVLPESIPFSVA